MGTNAKLIVDPFCGHGTILAAANYFKLNSFGVDLSLKRCKKAITRSLQEEIESVPITRRKLLGSRGDEVAVYKPYRANSRALRDINDESTQQTCSINDVTNEKSFTDDPSLSIAVTDTTTITTDESEDCGLTDDNSSGVNNNDTLAVLK